MKAALAANGSSSSLAPNGGKSDSNGMEEAQKCLLPAYDGK